MRVLIVAESISHLYSGGRAVRYLSSIIKGLGYELKIVVLTNNAALKPKEDTSSDADFDIVYINQNLRISHRISGILFNTFEKKQFTKLLIEYQPDIVHFASFDYGKPAIFISLAKRSGAKVILQPWTMGFFCFQKFGFRNNNICNDCLGGNFHKAISNKCSTFKNIFTLYELKLLQKHSKKADVFLSSNKSMSRIIDNYKTEYQTINYFPVPFSYEKTICSTTSDGDYFIFYGQATDYKGINILIDAFKELPNIKLKIAPINPVDRPTPSNIEIVNNMNWRNGLEELIAKSKAVIIPSLWETTTEYSLCEALLLKKTVIIFDVGFHKDVFVDKSNAMILKWNNKTDLIRAIEEINNDPLLRKDLGLNGYQTLLEINAPSRISKLLKEIYTQN